MSKIDKRNRLSEELFDYEITKKGTVIIHYKRKQIKGSSPKDVVDIFNCDSSWLERSQCDS